MKIGSNWNKVVKISLLFIFMIFAINFVHAIENNTIIKVFKCGNTTYYDDSTEPGRISQDGQSLVERKYNSLFEGEKIVWKVLVVDKNGGDRIQDVYVTLGWEPGINNDIEVNCIKSGTNNNWWWNRFIKNNNNNFNSCNLGDYKNEIKEFDNNTMTFYDCIFTTETPESMYGQNWVTVEAKDLDGSISIMYESEKWFFNPIISISINDTINFERLRPGKTGYSNHISVTNAADRGSGVIMDMFISGTNFSSDSELAYCPTKQILGLDRVKYYARNGEYDTLNLTGSDSEGYRPILYGIGFNNPNPFYNNYEMIPKNNDPQLPIYYLANELEPDDEINLKFKIDVPNQCKGDFEYGNIYFWGEAI